MSITNNLSHKLQSSTLSDIINDMIYLGHITASLITAILCITLSSPTHAETPQPTTHMPAPKEYPRTQEAIDDLGILQSYVTQKNGTEPAYLNKYWKNKDVGLYVDVVSGEPLFFSMDKFDSGTGWPSFSKPVNGHYIVEVSDKSAGMERMEVRSRYGDSHLGHVFPDGPREAGGLRYCINSASMRFIPLDALEKEGYGEYVTSFTSKTQ